MVGINLGILATEHVPSGGVKQAGLGCDVSRHGTGDYRELKDMCPGVLSSKGLPATETTNEPALAGFFR
jgi:succinate-semialdehyde dehydrogenase/glutarate-semialdehyde dehydrogenase